MIPISRRFCTVTVMSVLMIPKAATTTIKNNRKNITLRSSRTASKNWLVHVNPGLCVFWWLKKLFDCLFDSFSAVRVVSPER